MSDTYRTISQPANGLYKEKGSKFIAMAFAVYSTDEIKNHIERIEKEYYDARHVCYAWRLGLTDQNYRVNDDGEPSGTAGRPIYGQILSNELTNILIVVVRYFGGIKLGTGGLITAYKTAAADAIANATIIEQTLNDYYTISFPYESMNSVMKTLKDENPTIQSQQFDTLCSIKLNIRQSQSPKLLSKLEKIDGIDIVFEQSI